MIVWFRFCLVVCLGLGVMVVVWCCIGGRLDDVGCLYGEFGLVVVYVYVLDLGCFLGVGLVEWMFYCVRVWVWVVVLFVDLRWGWFVI